MSTVTRETGLLRDGLFHQGKGAIERLDAEELKRDPRGYGLRLLREQKGARAVVALTFAVEQAPDDVEARVGLARAFASCDRWDEAEPHLRRAVELDSHHYDARFLHAEALLQAGNYEAAEKQFQIAAGGFSLWRRMKAAFKTWFKPRQFLRRGTNPQTEDPEVKLEFARGRREDMEFAHSCQQTGKPNPLWSKSERGRRMRLRNIPLVRRETKIFTMGSCFALEIRHALLRRGYDVWPKISGLQFDQRSQIVDMLPDSDGLSHYDTFTIWQEFEKAFAGRNFELGDFWQIRGRNINKVMKCDTVWQDPYRKNIYASDSTGVVDLSRKLDACIREGIMAADVYVVTLGLIETWRNPANGFHACVYPGAGGGGGDQEAELHVASFEENYENMRRVCELIFSRFPDRQMVLTVSPVALERTFRDIDVVIANLESKSILRAVAGRICSEFSQVHYLPTYELFMYHDLFLDDGRHAARRGVETAIDLFARCFFAPEDTAV